LYAGYEPPPENAVNEEISDVMAFIEAQQTGSQTRGANKNSPTLGDLDVDWSRAKVWKDKEQKLTVTEVPTELITPYLYSVLVEKQGDTVSLATQPPHTRVLVYDYRGRQDTIFTVLATILPDEGWTGELDRLWANPVNEDFDGIALYSSPEGEPLWGRRFEMRSDDAQPILWR
jgi:hypothetical protein